MLNKLLEIATGKDDLERVAYKEDLNQLNANLKKRRLLIPKQPRQFLDASTFTQGELLALIENESKELSGGQFQPWILEVDGKKRLPAFSSRKKMETFSAKMSQQLSKFFSLGCIEILLDDLAKNIDVNFIDLNLFSGKSWEIGVNKK